MVLEFIVDADYLQQEAETAKAIKEKKKAEKQQK